jgi:hypothetical protein
MNVECSFGMLQERWGIYWRALEVPFYKVPFVVEATMKVHNFCIDHGDTVLTTAWSSDRPGECARSPITLQSDGCAEPLDVAAHNLSRMGNNKVARREQMRERLEQNKLRRPC